MTGRGRPAIGKRIEVRLPAHLVAALEASAQRTGVKRAELVRDIVAAYYAWRL